MAVSKAFLDYFKQKFFASDPEGFEAFSKSLLRPLKKTARVNRLHGDVTRFVSEKSAEGWAFSPTENALSFRVDREDVSVALGSTLEHLLGDLYVQELSASMSVWHLAEGWEGAYRTWNDHFLILDMAASPGGKTTQLAEHFPNSFVVANEFAKERLSSLIENVERMGHFDRTAVTNMNAALFGALPETFDRILLDAPCSGEGIGFKAEESLKYWNLKNVKTIARLQRKLLVAGISALKTGGELLYSTCTLNRFENEGVLESAAEDLPGTFEITFQKRFWPHVEEAGGFFVAKIRKTSPVSENAKSFRDAPNGGLSQWSPREGERIFESLHALGTRDFDAHAFFRYGNDVLAVRKVPGLDALVSKLYFLRMGERIGRMEHGAFEPNWILWKNRRLEGTAVLKISDESELHRYLSGLEPKMADIPDSDSGARSKNLRMEDGFSNASAPAEPTGYVQIVFKNRFLGLERLRGGRITNSFPPVWRRK